MVVLVLPKAERGLHHLLWHLIQAKTRKLGRLLWGLLHLGLPGREEGEGAELGLRSLPSPFLILVVDLAVHFLLLERNLKIIQHSLDVLLSIIGVLKQVLHPSLNRQLHILRLYRRMFLEDLLRRSRNVLALDDSLENDLILSLSLLLFRVGENLKVPKDPS